MNPNVFRLLVACLFTGGAILCLPPLLAQEKRPIPSAEAQQEAFKLIKEVYGQEWEPALYQALAAKLLQQAKASTDDDAIQYTLLHVAQNLAAQAGDVELAFKAIEAMTAKYDVDAYRLKGSALSGAAKSASTGQSVAVATLALALIDEAVDRDDFVRARFLGKLALSAARKGREGRLAGAIAARNTEVEALAAAFAEVQEAKKTLITDPVDLEANLAAGRYYCFDRGNWDRGLPYLALGADVKLQSLAIKELEGPKTAEDQVALGHGWWDLASAMEDSRAQPVRMRAAHWYRLARPLLAGLERAKVERRLAQVDEKQPPPPPPQPPRMKPSIVGLWTADSGWGHAFLPNGMALNITPKGVVDAVGRWTDEGRGRASAVLANGEWRWDVALKPGTIEVTVHRKGQLHSRHTATPKDTAALLAVSQRLRNTTWRNDNNVTFAWDPQSTLRRNGKPWDWVPTGSNAVAVMFGVDHIDTFLFSEDWSRYEQYSTKFQRGGRPLFMGRRQ